MLNIVFSIPIHEKLEVVLDQICNIQFFNPNCGIVFHLSKGFDYKNSLVSKSDFLEQIKKTSNVFVNPESVRTGFADIIQAHLSNFYYASKVCDFKYFAVCASNELFVRSGLYQYVCQYDCGYDIDILSNESKWYFGKVFQDTDLMKYMKLNGYEKIVLTHIEGVFFKKEIMLEIVNTICGFYNYKKMTVVYPREEIYFSTVAYNLCNAVKIGEIFTYSAYHQQRLLDVTRREISKVINSEGHLFSVKRVARNLNDYTRTYLRSIFGYYVNLVKMLPFGIKVNVTPSKYRVELHDLVKLVYRRFIYIFYEQFYTRFLMRFLKRFLLR